MKPPLRTRSIPALLATVALGVMSANAATTFTENFDDSDSLPAGWSATGDAAVFTDSSIARSDPNYLQMGTRSSNSTTTPSLGLAGATEATVSFYWTTTGTYSSAFGRRPQIQYSSDGTNFSTIAEFVVPSSNDGSTPRPYTFFTETIDTANDGFAFTADSAFRIVGDDDSGGGGAPLVIDDFSVTSNAIPEPSAALLVGLASLSLMRRRRPSSLFP